MSRIGKMPVEIPSGVQVTVAGKTVTVKGSKGELSFTHHEYVEVKVEDSQILVEKVSEEGEAPGLHGLTRALLANMVTGVTKGFTKKLEIIGVGYRAQATGSKIVLTVGYSHPVELPAPAGITVTMDEKEKNVVIITGIDKQAVGQFASVVRAVRKPEPYKGKGIRYQGEYVRRKAGKTSKK